MPGARGLGDATQEDLFRVYYNDDSGNFGKDRSLLVRDEAVTAEALTEVDDEFTIFRPMFFSSRESLS